MSQAYRMIDGKLELVEVSGCAKCGNTAGRFRVIGDKKYCVGKCRPEKPRDTSKNIWGFESMNISQDPNSGPVKVQSMDHLRRLEKEHGVVSLVGNYDSSNWERN